MTINQKKLNVLERGSDHYKKCKIQPIQYIIENNMNFPEGCIVKYITRYKYSGSSREDLEKIKHYVDLILELYNV